MLHFAAACTPGDDPGLGGGDEDTSSSDGVCSPALQLAPASSVVEAGSMVVLEASGGTGDHRFSMLDAPSGGTVGRSTGAYVAGSEPGGLDVVRVTDAGCTGFADATVSVLAPLAVEPPAAELPPATGLDILVSGGSGAWRCSLAEDGSGAFLSEDCGYTSGATTGRDRVRVTDTTTGTWRDVHVDVGPDNGLRVAGSGRVVIATDGTWTPSGTGGSGSWEFEVTAGPLEVVDDTVHPLEPGVGQVAIRDRHAPGLQLEVPVTVVAPLTAALPRDGERSGDGIAVDPGDIDGDGYPDAVLGFSELSIGGWTSGGVVIYAGTADGLAPEPARIIGGSDAAETLGRSVAIADLDGDGLPELIVGADRADVGATNNGRIDIHAGTEGAFFSTEPTRSLSGINPYGRLGTALAVCDFNGDGAADLAVGAMDDADQNVAVPDEKQGAVHVFLGSDGMLADEPDFVLTGVAPATDSDDDTDGDGWVGAPGIRLGTSLAAGDIDGDGLCDLASGAPDASGGDGAVLLWRGSATPGVGLVRTPSAWIQGEADAALGRRLASGDVDGDGKADLLVGGWTSDAGSTGGGLAAVFLSTDLPLDGDPVPLTVEASAHWWRYGSSSYERLGTSVDLDDLDGDGLDDVVIGSYRDEVGTGINEGTVTAFWGSGVASTPWGTDASAAEPDLVFEGDAANDRLGQAVAGLGDLDGDGIGDLLALAGHDSSHGIEVGAPYLVRTSDRTLDMLDLPGGASGHAFGQAIALVDPTGSGVPDLFVGAPEAGNVDVGANAGAVIRFAGTESGLDPMGLSVFGGHTEHDATDELGWDVSGAGDFDGDGYPDLALVARVDSQPPAFDTESIHDPDGCAASRSRAGSVQVHRGGPDGIDAQPAFIWYGPEAGAGTTTVRGGFDRNGDGIGDLAVSSPNWGAGGGFALVEGRAWEGGRTRVLCDAELWTSDQTYDRLGAALAPIGDLDGDGCEELLVGADGEEASSDHVNQGVVRLVWGTCTGSTVSTLTLDVVGSQVGAAIDAGLDVDDDGIPDAVVGGPAWRDDGAEIGAAWLVSGAHLLTAAREPLSPGVLPSDPLVTPLLPEDGLEVRVGVRTDEAGSHFGAEVALVPDPVEPALAAVAVASPLGGLSGVPRAGAVAVYRYDSATGLGRTPWGLIIGETVHPDSGVGERMLATTIQGRPTLIVGAPRSDTRDLDGGAVLVAPLTEEPAR